MDDDPGPRSLLRRNKKNKKPVNINIDKEADIFKLLEDFEPLIAKEPAFNEEPVDESPQNNRD